MTSQLQSGSAHSRDLLLGPRLHANYSIVTQSWNIGYSIVNLPYLLQVSNRFDNVVTHEGRLGGRFKLVIEVEVGVNQTVLILNVSKHIVLHS